MTFVKKRELGAGYEAEGRGGQTYPFWWLYCYCALGSNRIMEGSCVFLTLFRGPPKGHYTFDGPVFLTTPSSPPSSCLMYPVWRRIVGREMENRNQSRWTRRCSMHQVQTSLLSYPLIAGCRSSLLWFQCTRVCGGTRGEGFRESSLAIPLARTLAMFCSSVDALDLLADGGV